MSDMAPEVSPLEGIERQQDKTTNIKVILENRLPEWRELRNKKLQEADIKFSKLLEAYINTLPDNEVTTPLKAAIAEKNDLRDITKWQNIDEIEDENDMMDYIPPILRD